ncbi:hypothetical protein EDC04DRAFT_2922915 [Pisolithus marmoratus]|nr:hypothetical protein EDC04DRAFT_2922915 [Pisolithus marmoratus]
MASTIQYLTAKIAREINEELMSQAGVFSLDQPCLPICKWMASHIACYPQKLMELTGLSCAQALTKVYTQDTYLNVLSYGPKCYMDNGDGGGVQQCLGINQWCICPR